MNQFRFKRQRRTSAASASASASAASSGAGTSMRHRTTSRASSFRRTAPHFRHNHRHRSSALSATSSTTRTDAAIAANTNSFRFKSSHSLPQPSSPHIICAIGENLARETCVVSLDLAAPIILNVTKQCNGQNYAETLAYLSILRPDEVLMNEGRQHSPLATKVTQFYGLLRKKQRASTSQTAANDNTGNRNGNEDCPSATVVKFVSRAFFDQTKGADLLRRLARQDTYDATLVDEYILLSASHALLHYTQKHLGAVAFSKHCLDVRAHFGGPNRMEIDRSTILQLELLSNAKTGRTQNSLIGSIDRTKTTVGGQLLRTTLMAPPSRLDTINARLNLVDTFLRDENLFDAILRELKALPAIDKMLADVALIPNFNKHQDHHHLEPLHHIVGTSIASVTSGSTPVVSSSAFVKETTDRGIINVNARLANKGISALVCIKSTLEALPSLASILRDHLHHKAANGFDVSTEATVATDRSSLLIGLGVGGATLTKISEAGKLSQQTSHQQDSDQLLRAIVYALTQSELRLVCDTITDVFSETTSYKRNSHTMKYQECFALKSSSIGFPADNGQNGTNNDDGREIMDIIREAFLRNVDDIYRIADEYRERYGITVTVKFSGARGYFLSLPGDVESTLPNEFIQPGKSGKNIHCTTEEIQSLNIRAQDNIQDLLLMTHERIQSVLNVARSKYDALARVSDAIALLDLCHSFADKVTSSKQPWSRPLMTETSVSSGGMGEKGECEVDDSAITIRNGWFGIDVMDPTRKDLTAGADDGGHSKVIPNDTYAQKSKYFTIISGINGSGKSTYLKQVGIIVLLAHCGGYVPAEYAKVPLRNRIFARISTSDNQESNISTFLFEMKETAFICNNACADSLILLDELGRATSNEDGVAIAWSVSESLLSKKSLTFFVTHYPQMCGMSRIYPNVQNQHMEATISKDGDGTILYSHKVGNGPYKFTSDYGVEMAKYCGWPAEMVAEAREIENSLQDKINQNGFCYESERNNEAEIHNSTRLKSLSRDLQACVLESSSIDELRTSLQALKDSFKSIFPNISEEQEDGSLQFEPTTAATHSHHPPAGTT